MLRYLLAYATVGGTCLPVLSCSYRYRHRHEQITGNTLSVTVWLNQHTGTQLPEVNSVEPRVKEDILFPGVEHVLYASSNALRYMDQQPRIDF